MATILLVEDDPWSMRIARDVLERRGHNVLTATTTVDARDRFAESFDLVLLDIQLPGGSGVQLVSEIRATERLRSVPVVALTASAMLGDRERFLRHGFTAYLSKPIDVASFGATVERILGGAA